MAVKDDKVRKLVTLDKNVWADVEEIRFDARFKTESEAMRYLIWLGIECHHGAAKPSRPRQKQRKDKEHR